MRLIDADALADALFDKRKNYPQWVADVIGNMPEAVTRCKDCRWRANHGATSTKWLPCMDNQYDDDFFCADGERR